MYKLRIQEKLFGRESNLQSLSHYVGTPGTETILEQNVMLFPSQCWIFCFCDSNSQKPTLRRQKPSQLSHLMWRGLQFLKFDVWTGPNMTDNFQLSGLQAVILKAYGYRTTRKSPMMTIEPAIPDYSTVLAMSVNKIKANGITSHYNGQPRSVISLYKCAAAKKEEKS